MKLRYLAVAFAACLALPGAARADTYNLNTSDGPMRLHVGQDGRVEGHYPQRQGTMFGRVGPDGEVTGIWTQPSSDHPCREMRANTFAWGGFRIANIYSQQVDGCWGYCGEQPIRNWQMQRQ